MKIQNIQNNNTNFQGLHGNKNLLAKIPPRMLEDTGIKECADKFEVLITENKKCSNSRYQLILDSSEKYHALQVQVGEGIEKTLLGKTILTGITSAKFYFGQLFGEVKPTFLKSAVAGNIALSTNSNELKNYILSDKIDVRDLPMGNLEKYLNKDDYNTVIDYFAKQQLTKDKNGNLPLHNEPELYEFYTTNYYLKDKPEILVKIYSTKNKDGNLPLHNLYAMNDLNLLKEVCDILKNSPQDLVKIFETLDCRGESIFEYLQNIPSNDANTKRTCQKILHFVSNAKYPLNKTVQNLLRENNSKIKKDVIAEIKNIKYLNFNDVDENDISVIEHIMNSEDLDLVELLQDRTLYYRPELDYTYKRIENKDFKDKIDNLNFEFKELASAVKSNAIEMIELLASSPLYKKEYHGKKLQELILKYGNHDLEAKCKDFIPSDMN